MALPIYAADWQESEMQMLPSVLHEHEKLEAAVSTSFQQKRSLLVLTDDRLLVLHAEDKPSLLLDLPLEKVERTLPSSWYGSGNVTCFSAMEKYYFSLMSIAAYVPLAQKIEELARLKRQTL